MNATLTLGAALLLGLAAGGHCLIMCGGITADHPNLCDDLKVPTRLKLGALRADAGIVGAAFATTLDQGVWIKQAKVAGK